MSNSDQGLGVGWKGLEKRYLGKGASEVSRLDNGGEAIVECNDVYLTNF